VDDRHQLLKDRRFWLELQSGLSGLFQTCGNASLGGLWCDGFDPQFAHDTKSGVEVRGVAWIAQGNKTQSKCTFAASIPQRMLTRRESDFVITGLDLDLKRRKLRFSVAQQV
jgi:hypothetical protein